MVIIANSKDGFIIEASKREVEEILSAVSGVKPEKIEIGMKVPAIDYASTIKKIQNLNRNYEWQKIKEFNQTFTQNLKELDEVIQKSVMIDP